MRLRAQAAGIEPLAHDETCRLAKPVRSGAHLEGAQPSVVDGAQPRAGERLPEREAVRQ